jgi:pimeloyl-ACP methyl ester carboxylesterase
MEMKRPKNFIPAILLLVAIAGLQTKHIAAQGTRTTPDSISGAWTGAIHLPGAALGITVNLSRSASESWSGTIDIPAQGGKGIPLSNVVIDGKSVSFAMPGPAGNPTFKGELSGDGTKISGTFTQAGATFPFDLGRRVTTVTGDVSRIEARWQGTLSMAGTALRVVLRISRTPDGSYLAEMDSPDQGSMGMFVDILSVNNNAVQIRLTGIGAAFAGTLNGDGSRISGTWTQGAVSTPLILEKTAQTGSNSRPQEPRRPFPYAEEDVTYRNQASGLRLAGTLTLPTSGGPFPAAILISGSGQQDRDSTVFGHKPFLVLADYLTRNGVAVLRVDDRGVGGSDLGPLTATTEDFAGDVRTGINYLKSRPEINARQIGLIGHSEGGNIAPMVAAGTSDVRFIVLMAGAGVTGEQILYQQSALVLRSQGQNEALIAWDRSVRQRIFTLIKSEANGVPDEARRRALVQEIAPEYLTHPVGVRDEAAARNALETMLAAVSSQWFRFFLTYDPAPALTRVQCPVLAMIGENDLQVRARENLPAIEAALRAGKNKDFTVASIPKLNHLFQTSVTGSPDEYAAIEETIAPVALERISNWIHERVR